MFIDSDGKRWNKPYSRGTHFDAHGNERPNILWDDPEYRAAAGISEVSDPALPADVNDETHYIHHLDVPPYLEWTPKSQEQLDQLHNSKIQQQIQTLEKQAINDGLIRTLIEDLLMRFVEKATAAGITAEQLTNPDDPAYSPAFAKVKANDDARAELRRQKR